MADNPYKREICNMAVTILRQGKISDAGQFFDSIHDTEFADYKTASTQHLQRVCFVYESILKEVLRDIRPDFARQFADLSDEILINKERGSWNYLFELPTNFLDLVSQVNESDKDDKSESKILTFDSYAHVVKGDDDQAYYCSTAHTSVDDTNNGEPVDDDGNGNWTLYNADDAYGADWVEGWAYKASESGILLATNEYSNDDGDSAYIEYLAYVQAGISDKPQYYSDAFKRALAVRLASALTKDVEKQVGLLQRYNLHEKLEAWDIQDVKRFKGNRTPHGTVESARTNMTLT